jgi:hypothetical protein
MNTDEWFRAIPLDIAVSDLVGDKVLLFRQVAQEMPNWCWAAVTLSIFKFYEPNSNFAQCAIANYVLNQQTCCGSPIPDHCNVAIDLGFAMTKCQLLANQTDGDINYQAVVSEINNNRPIGVALYWMDQQNAQGGHAVVIYGYRNHTTGPWICIADPAGGSYTMIRYDDFPLHYSGGAYWGQTWTSRPPTSSVLKVV